VTTFETSTLQSNLLVEEVKEKTLEEEENVPAATDLPAVTVACEQGYFVLTNTMIRVGAGLTAAKVRLLEFCGNVNVTVWDPVPSFGLMCEPAGVGGLDDIDTVISVKTTPAPVMVYTSVPYRTHIVNKVGLGSTWL